MEYITEYILVRGEQNIYFINIYFPSKKIVVVILSDPPLKGAIPDSQRYPWILDFFIFQGFIR